MTKKTNRRQTRFYIAQALFAAEFHENTDPISFPEDIVKGLIDYDYASEVIEGVIAHKEDLDARIQAHSPKRKVAMLDPMDRSLMRLALWEMDHQIDPKVAINEAVNLAKVFGSDNSYKLVNAILDAYRKSQ